MSSFTGDKRVAVVLVIIAMGAVCLPIVRLRGAFERRAAAEAASAKDEPAASRPPTITAEGARTAIPGRDPFRHRSLFESEAGTTSNPFDGAGGGSFPAPPQGWIGDLTSDLPGLRDRANGETGPRAPRATGDSEATPRFTLTAIVGGSEPLAVIRDGEGRAHIVGRGDSLGRQVSVASVSGDAVTLRAAGREIVLRLGEG
jgi:hypothetical protein